MPQEKKKENIFHHKELGLHKANPANDLSALVNSGKKPSSHNHAKRQRSASLATTLLR